MSKLKKILMLVIILTLAFSSPAFTFLQASASKLDNSSKSTIQLQKKPELPNLPERLVNPVNPKETVRIIVELEGAPTIEEATKQGKLFKQLSSSQRKKIEANVEKEQVEVQAAIQKIVPNFKKMQSFTTVFNGFSTEVEAGVVEKIANIQGVKAVYEAQEYNRPEVQPEMIYSNDLVQSQQVWNNYELTGEGMIVGIIDTGIDPSHKDMKLTNPEKGALTKEAVEKLVSNGDIKFGKYYTEKVPFGYNYMDGNYEIRDLGPDASMHGMHVAGTVAANGDADGVKGVAPEAQLLALKVFGNDPLFPSTFGDIYVKAIDDAIKLGADVLNLSLGSVAGFVDENSPEQQAVERATDNGIVVSISAGNSTYFANGYYYPLASNPDYGVTGSPSVATDSIGVASLENTMVTAETFDFFVGDAAEGTSAIYLLANDKDPKDVLSGKIEVVYAGLGSEEEFANVDVKGKIALVQRGTYNFVDKALNAQAAGAIAVIIFNNTAGTINMANDTAIKIPYMFALQETGVAMVNAMNAGNKVFISFENPTFIGVPNPTAGEMSDFSSWGTAPGLEMKPEITAPGGNIFSTLNDNKYGLMSGTSMAAPHVSGAAALVLQRVDKDFELSGRERSKLAKLLLMNTAQPVYFDEENGEFYSPRRQGAGLMQIANAIDTDVIVKDKVSGEGKIALKEIQDDEFTVSLKLENFGDKAQTYQVGLQLQTDYPTKLGADIVVAPNVLGSIVFEEGVDYTTDAPKEVVVPAKGTAELTFKVNIEGSTELYEIFENGYYVEGFVTLTDATDSTANLAVPFVGFNGEWDKAPIFDSYRWDSNSYYGYTALIDNEDYFINGGVSSFDPTRFGFSPNGDGNRDTAQPIFSLLRNARELVVEVTDKDGKVLRTIRSDEYLTKNYANSSTNPPYKDNPNYAWDGKIKGKVAADGDYFIQVRAKIDFDGAEWQTLKFPIKVDTVAPTANVIFDENAYTLKFANIKDNEGGTGYYFTEIYINDELVYDTDKELTEYTVPAVTNADTVKVVVWDAALNYTEYTFKTDKKDKDEPAIFLDTPGYFDGFDTNEVEVSGYVEDFSDIVSVKVNGEEAELDGNYFTHIVTLEDGVHDIKVEATDKKGNSIQIARKIFVDTVAPTLSFADYKVETKESKTEVTFTVEDNFDEIRLYQDGDEIFFKNLTEPYDMYGFSKDFTVELELEDGENEFTFEVKDLLGHITSKTIKITKGENEVYLSETEVKFSDLDGFSWAETAIKTLANAGIINGVGDDKFNPKGDITREAFAALIVRALEIPTADEVEGIFADSEKISDWAKKEVEAAFKVGIVQGKDGNKFAPQDNITRQDMVVMIVRALNHVDESIAKDASKEVTYADADKIASYAKDSVGIATDLGIINGVGDNKFDPTGTANRAQAAQIIYNFLNVLE